MTNELLNEWKKEKIVEDGDIVLAGVSGGADSVCLLLMLEQLQKKNQIFYWKQSMWNMASVGKRAGKMQRL